MKVGLAAAVVLTAGMLALRSGSKVKEGAADAAMQDATAAARVPSVGSADPGADAVASRAPVDVNERAGAKAARKRGQRGRPATAGADGQAIEAEVRLISVANGLVRDRRFGEALRVLEHHERRFPRGALREERGALRVLSLCADEPDARARREGERFLRTSPRSVLAARVRAACAAP